MLLPQLNGSYHALVLGVLLMTNAAAAGYPGPVDRQSGTAEHPVAVPLTDQQHGAP